MHSTQSKKARHCSVFYLLQCWVLIGSYWIHDQVQEDSFVDLACEVGVIRLNNAADMGDRSASQQEAGADMEVAVILSAAGSYRKL